MRRQIIINTCCVALCLGFSGGMLAEVANNTIARALAADADAPAWTVDKTGSRIGFKSSFSGMSFEGSFRNWDAKVKFDPKNLVGSKAVVTVDLASASSGDNNRDETMPTQDWFDVAKFPRATFNSTSITAVGGGRYQAAGLLTLKGISRPVVLAFTLAIQGNTAQMTGQVVIERNEFGVGQGQFAGSDTVPFDVVVAVTVTATLVT